MRPKIIGTQEIVVVLHRSDEANWTQLGDSGYDIGEPFLMMSATDLWSTIIERHEAFELCVLHDNKHLLSCKIEQDDVDLVRQNNGFLLVNTAAELDDRKLQALFQQLAICNELVQIEQVLRRFESTESLPDGEIDGVLVGCWNEKPF